MLYVSFGEIVPEEERVDVIFCLITVAVFTL